MKTNIYDVVPDDYKLPVIEAIITTGIEHERNALLFPPLWMIFMGVLGTWIGSYIIIDWVILGGICVSVGLSNLGYYLEKVNKVIIV